MCLKGKHMKILFLSSLVTHGFSELARNTVVLIALPALRPPQLPILPVLKGQTNPKHIGWLALNLQHSGSPPSSLKEGFYTEQEYSVFCEQGQRKGRTLEETTSTLQNLHGLASSLLGSLN